MKGELDAQGSLEAVVEAPPDALALLVLVQRHAAALKHLEIPVQRAPVDAEAVADVVDGERALPIEQHPQLKLP